MIYNGIISGRYVDLRSATLDDAEFTLNIRLDPEIKKCFPPFDSNIEKQKIWLSNQMQKNNDYFFIIIDKQNNQRIGTISVYDIDYKKKDGESGRLIIQNENPFIPVEAFFLLLRFAFHEIGLQRLHGFIMNENKRAISFNKFFGFSVFPPIMDEKINHLVLPTELLKENYIAKEIKFQKYLYEK